MEAVILAGGFGQRLRPITDARPKPLVPIANRSAIERMLSLLAKHGCTRAVITLYYQGEQIKQALGDRFGNTELCYITEETPLGTAGSVRAALPHLQEERCLVVSGDVVCQTDLSAMLAFHKEKNALATLALTKQDPPGEYGVVLTDTDGRILRFLEKPDHSQAVTDTVNTGIYCLERSVLASIPQGKSWDFGADLFPALLGKGLYAYTDPNPWCDVGDPESFYRCSMELAQQEGQLQGSNLLAPTATLDIAAEAERSILFSHVRVGSGSRIFGSILCENVTVGRSVRIEEGTILGANCQIKDGAVIGRGVRLPAGTVLSEGSVCMPQYTFAKAWEDFFSLNGIEGRKAEISSEFALQLGKAMASVSPDGMALLHADTPYCSLLASAFRCGVIAMGGQLSFCGIGFPALSAFHAKEQQILTLCISEEANAHIRISFFDKDGLSPNRAFRRSLNSAFAKQHLPDPAHLGRCDAKQDPLIEYRKVIASLLCPLEGLPLYLNHTLPAKVLGAVCRDNGARLCAAPDALRLILDPSGQRLSVFECQKEPFCCDFWHVLALLLAHEQLPKDQVLAFPYDAPVALLHLAQGHGYRTQRYASCPHDASQTELRHTASALPILRDSVLAAAALLKLKVNSDRSLAALSAELPAFFTCVRETQAPASHRLQVLCAMGEPDGDGVRFDYGVRRHVRVIPLGLRAYRLICEAESAEAAEELFVQSQKKMDRLIGTLTEKEEE